MLNDRNSQTHKRALQGTRILDLTMVWAGPYCTRLLGDLGAEVIKIESDVRYDGTRGATYPKAGIYPEDEPGEHPYNRSGYFNKLNRNKCSLSLNLSRPKGREIFKRLVRLSDVVVESYSPRVMGNFGLDYPVLRQIKSDIIMISLPGFGSDGPYRDYVAFGTGIEAMIGLTNQGGYAEGKPIKSGVAYPDPVAGAHAAFAVLTALHYRGQTGNGQYIDLSQRESALQFIGEMVMENAVNGNIPERLGNNDSMRSPQGCYRCKGEDSWVVLSVKSDEEWLRLCEVMSRPDLALDPRFNTLSDRTNLRETIDNAVEHWTVDKDHYEVMQLLQAVGISAGPVLNSSELLSDRHLHERMFFETIQHPETGVHSYPGIPFKLSLSPGSVSQAAPCFGEHNDYIFGTLLGFSDEEIASLEEEGVTSRSINNT